MRRTILLALMLSLLLASTAYAHVAGSFGDFLLGIKNESTTEKLKNEIKETKEEIEYLTPQVKQMEAEYDQMMGEAEPIVQFYTTIGLDTYMNFLVESDGVVDFLANQRIIEKRLEGDLQQLNSLYLHYMPLKLAKESLEGHIGVLKMIESNLAARTEFLAANPNLTPEELANRINITWEAQVGSLDDILLQDSELLNEHIAEFVSQKSTNSPYRIEETLFNKQSELTYYFRSDHVYVHYKKEDADVILIGTISKKNENTIGLEFEAGFLNGIMLSGDLLKQLPGLELNYKNLNYNSKGFYVEQINGAIVVQPIEQAVE